MSPNDKLESYITKEGRMQIFRFVTPLLIVMVGFFCRDYLTRIDGNTSNLYRNIGDLKTSVMDYELKSETRFAILETKASELETEIYNLSRKVDGK